MRRQLHEQRGTVAVLAAATLFGTTGTVLVNAPDGADAWSVAPLRLLVGGLTLMALARRSSGWVEPLRQRSTLVGVAGVAVYQLGSFLAVTRTGVAVGTVTTIGAGPILSGAVTTVTTRTTPPPRWMLGTLLGIAGVALLGLAGSDATIDPGGIALAGLAGCGWATYTTVGKHQIDRGTPSTASMAALFTGGGLALLPLLAWHSPRWAGTPSGVVVAAYLGVVTVGVAYWLYGFALRHLAAPTVITLTLLEPITAALLGAVVVHEGIRPAGWAGIGLVLAGLVAITTVRA